MARYYRIIQFTLTALLGALLVVSAVSADGKSDKGRVYRVAITNVTKGQIFSPPVLATHNKDIRVFMAGKPASAELVDVAENGVNGPLAAMLDASPDVFDVVAADAPVMPGETAYYEIRSRSKAGYLSIVGMLVSSNDAIFGVNARKLSSKSGRGENFVAIGYDAGSEGNNEICSFVPGPPCGNGPNSDRDTAGAEGYVYVHNGIHGIADLDASARDWRNPVARITVKRIH